MTGSLTQKFVKEIMRLHGVPKVIIFNSDPKFMARFWQTVHEAFRTKLKFNMTLHSQTDGQMERTIQTLEDLLRLSVKAFLGNQISCLPLIEFVYNKSYHSSIGMASYEALHLHKCRMPFCWQKGKNTCPLNLRQFRRLPKISALFWKGCGRLKSDKECTMIKDIGKQI